MQPFYLHLFRRIRSAIVNLILSMSFSGAFRALQPPRRLLFTPGPTMVEPAVYEALAKSLVGPLDPYFMGVLGEVRQMLRSAFGTGNHATYVASGTGSAGMETAIANFV